jgi:hypothetical protein
MQRVELSRTNDSMSREVVVVVVVIVVGVVMMVVVKVVRKLQGTTIL